MTTRLQDAGGRKGVYAARHFAPGEVLLPLDGIVVDRPHRYSLQIAADRHLAPRAGFEDESAWCFINHQCDPNCRIDVARMALVALKAVSAGDEVSFNYCSTEYDIASPFGCHCGAAGCYRQVRGFRHLSDDEKQRLRGLLAPHLLALTAVDV